MHGNKAEARSTNNWLETLNARAHECRQHLYASGKAFTGNHIRKLMQGEELEAGKTLADAWNYHTLNIAGLIGRGYSEATLKKYQSAWKALGEYMKLKYQCDDMRLDKLDYQFIKEYDHFLRAEYGVQNNTAVGMVKKVRTIVRIALDYGWIARDPFLPLRMKLVEVHRDYLTGDELNRLASKKISSKRLAMTRDLFLFSCYTGLSYGDASRLEEADLITGEDGERWIQTHRIKNNNRVRVPLLAPAQKIIQHFHDHPHRKDKMLLPTISNQKVNAYLKEVTKSIGLTKNLTFHCARHTFATTVTLTNGVPIETVGQMLGHKSIRSTQHYARVTDTKVAIDMKSLKVKYEVLGLNGGGVEA